jgi:hypothetical protein
MNANDERLGLVAQVATLALLEITVSLYKRMEENIDDLKNSDDQKKNDVGELLLILMLFHAQRFFWENVIQDEKIGTRFEINLYAAFKKETKIDPVPGIKDYVAYIKRIGDRGEVQYVGWEINKILGEQNLESALNMSENFFATLKDLLFKAMVTAWEMSDKELQEIVSSDD